MSAPPKDALDALIETVRKDPYRVLGLAALVGLAGGARLWRDLAGAGARIVIAAAVPSLIGAIQMEAADGRTPRD
jgi:hypothetical protein